MSDTSMKTGEQKSVKQLTTTLLNSLNQGPRPNVAVPMHSLRDMAHESQDNHQQQKHTEKEHIRLSSSYATPKVTYPLHSK